MKTQIAVTHKWKVDVTVMKETRYFNLNRIANLQLGHETRHNNAAFEPTHTHKHTHLNKLQNMEQKHQKRTD